MGHSPWGHKESDTTERLNNKNNNGGERGCVSFPLLSTGDRCLGFALGQEEKAAALRVTVLFAVLLSRLFVCCALESLKPSSSQINRNFGRAVSV